MKNICFAGMLKGESLKITVSANLALEDIPGSLKKDLIQKLTFINPKWLENEKMGRWNRDTEKYLKYYEIKDKNKLIIPRGYARQLILLCRKNNIAYELYDKRRALLETDFTFHGKLNQVQQAAVKRMLKKDFGTLCAPTGSGKTVLCLYMIARRKQPSLIVVHTKDLAFQWMERIGQFLNISPEETGLIGAGKKKTGEKITVALVQSLYKCKHEVAPNIGYLVVDECHHAPSRTFTQVVSSFDCKYMLGLTATPWRRDKLSRLIFWFLGDIHYTIEKQDLIEKGHILAAKVIFRKTEFKPFHDPADEYSKMLLELTSDDGRNTMITDDVAKEVKSGKGVCLVLSDRKKHCETLAALLKYRHGIDALVLTGDLPVAKRRKIIDRVNSGKAKVLMATGQLIGEGFDCKELSTLFIATPVRFKGRLMQYLGRIVRPAPGKIRATVYDYVDINVKPLVSAAISRQSVYGTDHDPEFKNIS